MMAATGLQPIPTNCPLPVTAHQHVIEALTQTILNSGILTRSVRTSATGEWLARSDCVRVRFSLDNSISTSSVRETVPHTALKRELLDDHAEQGTSTPPGSKFQRT